MVEKLTVSEDDDDETDVFTIAIRIMIASSHDKDSSPNLWPQPTSWWLPRCWAPQTQPLPSAGSTVCLLPSINEMLPF